MPSKRLLGSTISYMMSCSSSPLSAVSHAIRFGICRRLTDLNTMRPFIVYFLYPETKGMSSPSVLTDQDDLATDPTWMKQASPWRRSRRSSTVPAIIPSTRLPRRPSSTTTTSSARERRRRGLGMSSTLPRIVRRCNITTHHAYRISDTHSALRPLYAAHSSK